MSSANKLPNESSSSREEAVGVVSIEVRKRPDYWAPRLLEKINRARIDLEAEAEARRSAGIQELDHAALRDREAHLDLYQHFAERCLKYQKKCEEEEKLKPKPDPSSANDDKGKSTFFQTDPTVDPRFPGYEAFCHRGRRGSGVDFGTWNKYMQELNDSEGFEVSHHPGNSYAATIRPASLDSETSFHFVAAQRVAKKAIQKFNEDEGVNYEFHRLERVNYMPCAGLVYYVTFKASMIYGVPKRKHVKTFQTRSWYKVNGEDAIYFCRLKEGNKRCNDKYTRSEPKYTRSEPRRSERLRKKKEISRDLIRHNNERHLERSSFALRLASRSGGTTISMLLDRAC